MSGDGRNLNDRNVTVRDPEEDHEDTVDMSWKFVLVMVVVMCVMLVSLYFLFDYLGKFSVLGCLVNNHNNKYFLCKNGIIAVHCSKMFLFFFFFNTELASEASFYITCD